MSGIGAEREAWLEKSGVFYPLLVAAQAQSRLPLAGALVPSDEDLRASLKWLPLVGAALGVLWAFVAAACFEVGLSRFVSATLVVAFMVISEGLLFEMRASRAAQGALRGWQRRMQQASEGDQDALVVAATVTLSIVLRIAALSAVPESEYTGTLLAAAILSRWVLSMPALVGEEASTSTSWLSYGAIAAAVALTIALCAGAGGLLVMALAGAGVALLLRRARGQSLPMQMEQACALALAVELLVLV